MLSNQDAILSVRGLSKSFPGVQALKKVSLDIWGGEIHVVMGENGAGKSTLMKILAGVYTPDEGDIYLGHQKIKIENPLKARHFGISLIYQELSIAGNLTVAENIFMGSEPNKFGLVNYKEMVRKSKNVLALFLGTQGFSSPRISYSGQNLRYLAEAGKQRLGGLGKEAGKVHNQVKNSFILLDRRPLPGRASRGKKRRLENSL